MFRKKTYPITNAPLAQSDTFSPPLKPKILINFDINSDNDQDQVQQKVQDLVQQNDNFINEEQIIKISSKSLENYGANKRIYFSLFNVDSDLLKSNKNELIVPRKNSDVGSSSGSTTGTKRCKTYDGQIIFSVRILIN